MKKQHQHVCGVACGVDPTVEESMDYLKVKAEDRDSARMVIVNARRRDSMQKLVLRRLVSTSTGKFTLSFEERDGHSFMYRPLGKRSFPTQAKLDAKFNSMVKSFGFMKEMLIDDDPLGDFFDDEDDDLGDFFGVDDSIDDLFGDVPDDDLDNFFDDEDTDDWGLEENDPFG